MDNKTAFKIFQEIPWNRLRYRIRKPTFRLIKYTMVALSSRQLQAISTASWCLRDDLPHEQKLFLGPDTAGGKLGRELLSILNRCVFDQPDALEYDEAVKMIHALTQQERKEGS